MSYFIWINIHFNEAFARDRVRLQMKKCLVYELSLFNYFDRPNYYNCLKKIFSNQTRDISYFLYVCVQRIFPTFSFL